MFTVQSALNLLNETRFAANAGGILSQEDIDAALRAAGVGDAGVDPVATQSNIPDATFKNKLNQFRRNKRELESGNNLSSRQVRPLSSIEKKQREKSVQDFERQYPNWKELAKATSGKTEPVPQDQVDSSVGPETQTEPAPAQPEVTQPEAAPETPQAPQPEAMQPEPAPTTPPNPVQEQTPPQPDFASLSKQQKIDFLENLYHQTWNYFARNVVPQLNRETQQAKNLMSLFKNVRPTWKSLRDGIRNMPEIADALDDNSIAGAHKSLTDAFAALQTLQQSSSQDLSNFQQQLSRAINAINAMVQTTQKTPGQQPPQQAGLPPAQPTNRPPTVLAPRQPTQLKPNIANKTPVLTASMSSAMRIMGW